MRNIRTLTSLCAAVSTALVCLSARASDEMFAKKAAAGGMAEVAAGDTAQKMGANDAVKKYGQQMTVDHTKANDELKSLASAKKIELPTVPDPAHHVAEEEGGYFLKLRETADGPMNSKLTRLYREEFERYMGA